MAGATPNAALEGGGEYGDFAYFFAGTAYYRYSWSLGRPDPGYPQGLSAWSLPGAFADGVDTALNGRESFTGKAYFFRGSEYVRYDWATDTVDGSPAPISAWGLTGPFADGVDAALNGSGEYSGKVYFFRGDQYARYDWATDAVDIPDGSLSAWSLPPGVDDVVTTALDGAADWDGKAYLFHGDQYVRYDWLDDRPDPEFPQPIDDWQLMSSFIGTPDTSDPGGGEV